DVQLVEPPSGARHAHDAPAVRDHEVDRVRGHGVRGHHEVTLVLAVGVVDHDDDPARGDVLDGVVDGVEHGPVDIGHRCATKRSTYFASTSTSTFTGSPRSARPSVVTSSVCGTSATVKRVPSSAATVRLTPSTATDPFSTR